MFFGDLLLNLKMYSRESGHVRPHTKGGSATSDEQYSRSHESLHVFEELLPHIVSMLDKNDIADQKKDSGPIDRL